MPDWGALDRELDQWGESGQRATFWWRDDDAVSDTPRLRRLLDLAGRHAAPLSLAVIPRDVRPTLPALLSGTSVSVLQHGYSHFNHAPTGEKKCEFGAQRLLGDVLRELGDGQDRLQHQFTAEYLAVLVPPWNRIDDRVTAALGPAGFVGLSRYTPRRALHAAPGVVQVNTHVDPIAWKQGRAFLGTEGCLDMLVAHLSSRRTGLADRDEPTGLLTHHLVHDTQCWRFIGALLERTATHGASRWIDAREAFGLTCGRSA